MSRIRINDALWVVGIIAVTVIIFVSLYRDRVHNQMIDAIMTGPVRANVQSGVFHVPTCPQYDDIGGRNIRMFETADEAEAAGFRPSMNCLKAIHIRQVNDRDPTPYIDPSIAIDGPR